MEHFGNAIAGWENTLYALKSKKQGAGADVSDGNLITQMDPDAPNREKIRRLHPLDKEDDMRLLGSMFARLRCGQLMEAQQLCFRAGQPFRAAMLEGWKLYHDSNMKLKSSEAETKGITYPSIWRLEINVCCIRTFLRKSISRCLEDDCMERMRKYSATRRRTIHICTIMWKPESSFALLSQLGRLPVGSLTCYD